MLFTKVRLCFVFDGHQVRLIRRHSLWQKSLKNARKFIFYKIIIEFIKPLAFNFNKLALLIKKLQFIILEFL